MAAETSYQALALRPGAARGRRRLVDHGRADRRRGRRARRRSRRVRRRPRSSTCTTPSSPTTPPRPGASAAPAASAGRAPAAVVATGTDRGNEVLAHVAAIADQPFAANVTDVDAVGERPWRSPASAGAAACSSRRRSTADVPILSCAPHAFAGEPAPASRRRAAVTEFDADARPDTPRARASSTGSGRRGHHPHDRAGRRQRRPGRRLRGGLRRDRGAGRAARRRRRLLAASSPTTAGGRTPTRSARPASASPPSSTSRAASPAPYNTGWA